MFDFKILINFKKFVYNTLVFLKLKDQTFEIDRNSKEFVDLRLFILNNKKKKLKKKVNTFLFFSYTKNSRYINRTKLFT